MKTFKLATRTGLSEGEITVDRENWTMHGVSVITRGPAIGHGFDIDDQTLAQVRDAINESGGVRSRLTHPSPFGDDGILLRLGRWQNAVLDEEAGKVRADFQFGSYADRLPGRGDARSYLADLIDEDPAQIGISIYAEGGLEERTDEKGQTMAPAFRIANLMAADFVDDPAANPDGLLSRGEGNHRTRDERPHDPMKGDVLMDPKVLEYLQAQGLKAGATLPEMLAFVNEELDDQQRNEVEKLAAAAAPAKGDGAEMVNLSTQMIQEAADEAKAEQAKLDGDRLTAIVALGKEHGKDAEWALGLYKDGQTVEQAKDAILADLAKERTAVEHTVSVGEDGNKRALSDGMRDAMLLRAGVKLKERDTVTGEVRDVQPSPLAGKFRHASLMDMGKAHLEQIGIATDGVPPSQLARRVFAPRTRHTALAMGSDDFPHILGDAANKALLVAYEEYPRQWATFAARQTVRDFKTVRMIRKGALGNLSTVLEGGEYEEIEYGENQETATLVKRGNVVVFTWETMINDDLGAFDGTLADLGQAAARTEDSVAFSVLTTNDNLSDGVALFAAGHGNLAVGGDLGAPSVETLNAAAAAMGVQTAVGSDDAYLNIMPSVIVAPQALRGTVTTLLQSTNVPGSENNDINIWQDRLTPVFHAILDADSETGWYLLANPNEAPVIRMLFLDGEEGPQTDEEEGFLVDGVRYKIRHTVAAGVADYRGAYSNPGA